MASMDTSRALITYWSMCHIPRFLRKYWWGLLLFALLIAAEIVIVCWRGHAQTVETYRDANTLSRIALYDADNPDLYVHIMATSEFATGGFSDYSEELLHPSDETVGSVDAEDAGTGASAGDGITHEQMLYLFLPYEEGDKDWRLGMAEGLSLVIDERTYHAGDRITGLEEGTAYGVSLCDAAGNVLERGPVTVRYNGSVPVLFCESEDTEEYNAIRFTKHIDANVSWFCLDGEGSADSYGTARMSGHGNSTYDIDHKKPLNLRLDNAQSILGMGAIEKYVLIANSMDPSNLKDKIVYEAAARLGMENTPQCEYVCYYVNGEYEGLYLLSEKVDIGKGCITSEHDLDSDAKDLNSEYPAFEIGYGETDTDLPYAYFAVANTPVDCSGAYLLELQMPGIRSSYIGAADHDLVEDGAWFKTGHLDMLIRSPGYASEREVTYIRDLVLAAEAALYAEDGVNPDTGRSYADYYDVDSWGALLLLQDFYALQDYSLGSIFVLKRQGDDTLYAGPVWDYDKALTDDYYNADTTRFAIDGRTGLTFWMYRLSVQEEIRERMRSLYVEQFSDIMMQMVSEDIPAWIEEISAAAATDNLRWGYDETRAATSAGEVLEWCVGRTAYYNSVWVTEEVQDPEGRIWGRPVDHNGNDVEAVE